jgi:SAM-dependent methyltransferase
MITDERWMQAQKAETDYWAHVSQNQWHVLYELTEHYQAIVPILKRFLQGRSNLRAIEVGVGGLGIGFLAVYAHSYCKQIVGIEPLPVQNIALDDKDLERYTRSLQSRVEIRRQKAKHLPFENETFDLACCINVLDHTHDPYMILGEVNRVLNGGGVLVLSVHTRSWLVRLKWRIQKALKVESEQAGAHPYTFGWGHLNARINESWRVLWQNKPSAFGRFVGLASFSIWVLEKKQSLIIIVSAV